MEVVVTPLVGSAGSTQATPGVLSERDRIGFLLTNKGSAGGPEVLWHPRAAQLTSKPPASHPS